MNNKKRIAATASLVPAIVLLVIAIHSREEQPKSATGHNDGAKPLVATTLLALQESGEPRGTISEPLHMTGDESTALRRAFMAEFAASNAAARAKGGFLYAGRSVDTATSGRAPGFAQPHDEETMAGLAPFAVLLKGQPKSSDYREIFGDVALSSYVPPRGYVLLLNEEELAGINALDTVLTTFEVTPEYKIEPFLTWFADNSGKDSVLEVSIRLFDVAIEEAVIKRLKAIAPGIEKMKTFDGAMRLAGEARLSQLAAIAQIGGVEWIEERSEPKLFNNLAVLDPRMNVKRVWEDWGLHGEGEIVGHADTGLDTGDTATLHPDMRGRVTGTATWNGRGTWNDLHLHGTHTAGSIIGDGTLSGGAIKGVAYKSHLFHQSLGTVNNTLEVPYDPAFLLDEAAQAGARVHSDSWGSSVFGLYTSFDEMFDSYVWGNQNFLPVVSAGNDGMDGNYTQDAKDYLDWYGIVIPDAITNGVIDSMSIGSPAQAKNSLAVGATESDRLSGSMSWRTWGSTWPGSYKNSPIKDDIVSVGITDGGVYHQGMAAFSSRGPTFCGRVKPDVTAPGCDVLSTRYTVGSKYGWGSYSPNPRYYNYYGGTSMSCPLVAGAAALVREHLAKRVGIAEPTAALLRAALINGSVSITPGQYGTGGFREVPEDSPNSVEGWGQVNLGNSLYAPLSGNIFYDRISNGTLKTGNSDFMEVTVINTNAPLKATLTWADYPTRPAAAYHFELVNDLDLLIESPSGASFWGNGIEGGDRTNNVEKIVVENPEPGTYRILVIGANIMVTGSQPALVVTGGVNGIDPIIVPRLIEDTTPVPSGYEAVLMINSVIPYEGRNSVDFSWAIGNANAATGAWTHVAVSAEADGQTYQHIISGDTPPGEVYYAWNVPGTPDPITNSFTIIPFEVAPSMVSHTFGYVGGVTNFTITANTSWNAESTNSWIVVAPDAGVGNGFVELGALTNYAPAPRNGLIVISGGDVTNELAVFQEAWSKIPGPPMLASPVFAMSGTEVSITFSGERNNAYTLQWRESLSEGAWLDLTSTTVHGDGPVTLAASVFPGHTGLPATAFFRVKSTPLVE